MVVQVMHVEAPCGRCADPHGWGVVCPLLAERSPRAQKVVVHMHRSTRHRERTQHALGSGHSRVTHGATRSAAQRMQAAHARHVVRWDGTALATRRTRTSVLSPRVPRRLPALLCRCLPTWGVVWQYLTALCSFWHGFVPFPSSSSCSRGSCWLPCSPSSVNWYSLHFMLLPNSRQDEAVFREALGNLVRSRSAEKHVHIVLVIGGLREPHRSRQM